MDFGGEIWSLVRGCCWRESRQSIKLSGTLTSRPPRVSLIPSTKVDTMSDSPNSDHSAIS